MAYSFSLQIGPRKLIWISSLGSAHFICGFVLEAGISGLWFLPICLQGLNFDAWHQSLLQFCSL